MAELTSKQRQSIEALVTERTIGEAAKAAGVGERTLHRWLAEDITFQSALRDLERRTLEGFTRRLVKLSEKAALALEDALDDPSIHVRLKAADTLLGRLIALRELVDIEERLAALEGANRETKN